MQSADNRDRVAVPVVGAVVVVIVSGGMCGGLSGVRVVAGKLCRLQSLLLQSSSAIRNHVV